MGTGTESQSRGWAHKSEAGQSPCWWAARRRARSTPCHFLFSLQPESFGGDRGCLLIPIFSKFSLQICALLPPTLDLVWEPH